MNSSDNGIVLGDINFDNLINVQDIVLLVGIILNDFNPIDFQIYSGNVNNDDANNQYCRPFNGIKIVAPFWSVTIKYNAYHDKNDKTMGKKIMYGNINMLHLRKISINECK